MSDNETETPVTTTREMTDANQLAGALLAAMNDRTVKDKLPTFSGRDSKPRDCTFREWKYMFNKITSNDSSLSCYDKERLVLQSLQGEARQRYIRLDSNNATLDDIIAKFSATYGDMTSDVERIEKFNNLHQHAKESSSDFADRVEKLAYWVSSGNDSMSIYCTNQMLKSKFSRGLNNQPLAESLNYIVDDEQKSFEDLRHKVLALEQRQSQAQATKPKQPVTAVQDSVMEKILQRLEALEAKMNEKPAQPPRSDRPRIECTYCHRHGHTQEQCHFYLRRQAQDSKKTGN